MNTCGLCCDNSVGNTVVTAAVVEAQKNSKLKNTLKLDFKFDSMTLVLYSPNENVVMHTHTYTGHKWCVNI